MESVSSCCRASGMVGLAAFRPNLGSWVHYNRESLCGSEVNSLGMAVYGSQDPQPTCALTSKLVREADTLHNEVTQIFLIILIETRKEVMASGLTDSSAGLSSCQVDDWSPGVLPYTPAIHLLCHTPTLPYSHPPRARGFAIYPPTPGGLLRAS